MKKLVAIAFAATFMVTCLGNYVGASDANAAEPDDLAGLVIVADAAEADQETDQVVESTAKEETVTVDDEVTTPVDDNQEETTVCPIKEVEEIKTEPENVPEAPQPVDDTDASESEADVNDPAPDTSDHTEDCGCEHKWVREYEPETETEWGYVYHSCLYCGEWYVLESIPPIGESN